MLFRDGRAGDNPAERWAGGRRNRHGRRRIDRGECPSARPWPPLGRGRVEGDPMPDPHQPFGKTLRPRARGGHQLRRVSHRNRTVTSACSWRPQGAPHPWQSWPRRTTCRGPTTRSRGGCAACCHSRSSRPRGEARPQPPTLLVSVPHRKGPHGDVVVWSMAWSSITAPSSTALLPCATGASSTWGRAAGYRHAHSVAAPNATSTACSRPHVNAHLRYGHGIHQGQGSTAVSTAGRALSTRFYDAGGLDWGDAAEERAAAR